MKLIFSFFVASSGAEVVNYHYHRILSTMHPEQDRKTVVCSVQAYGACFVFKYMLKHKG